MNRKFWLIAPWAAFALLALGWIAYWNVVAGGAERQVQAWIAAQNDAGAEASVGRIVRRGFPVLLRLELHEAAYAPEGGGWRVSTPQTDLHVHLINPQHVTFEAKAPIAVARDNGHVTSVTADALIATARMSGGVLAAGGIEADNLSLDDPAEDGVLTVRKLVVNVRPDPRAAREHQLAFEARGIMLPRPVRSFEAFGLEAPLLRAAIVVEQSAALLESGEQEDPLEPWREAGGRLRFEAIELNWGPLQSTGTGHGGLDEQRRLQGELRLPIERPAPVLTAIANGPNVSEDAKRALGLLAAGYAISGDDITLDVEANGGVLRLEGLGVRLLPPVY